MSISDKITALQGDRDNIRTALSNKGIDASAHGFSSFASDIANIVTPVVGSFTGDGSQTATIADCIGKDNIAIYLDGSVGDSVYRYEIVHKSADKTYAIGGKGGTVISSTNVSWDSTTGTMTVTGTSTAGKFVSGKTYRYVAW